MNLIELFNDYNPELETKDDYLARVFPFKVKYEMTWDDFADIVNNILGNSYTESYYRKHYYKYVEEHLDKESAQKETVTDLLLELKKEKVKLTDERTQNNAFIRRLAREETIKELGIEAAEIVASSKPFILTEDKCVDITDDKEAIIMLSDWHYGIEVDSMFNKFNTEIAKTRISKLCNSTIDLIRKYKVCKLTVMNLSDLIAGRIHLTIRLQSRIDVITQIIEVSEILAEFMNKIHFETGVEIDYYDCCDNHSRIEPNKSDSLQLETLSRMTPWYLKTRFKDVNFIRILDNEYSDSIITANILGHKVAAVHGDIDYPGKVVDNLTLMTHQSYDMVLTAHLHHFSCDEKNECLVVSNGTLMGTDSYAEKLRLSSKPSQNFIIVSKDNPAESIHRILL